MRARDVWTWTNRTSNTGRHDFGRNVISNLARPRKKPAPPKHGSRPPQELPALRQRPAVLPLSLDPRLNAGLSPLELAVRRQLPLINGYRRSPRSTFSRAVRTSSTRNRIRSLLSKLLPVRA